MTLVGVLSVKGAPGVTTLSCLLAASWPVPGRALVVEADPSGGALGARFGLRAGAGVASLAAAARRGGPPPAVDDHLQELPGGVPVLVAAPDEPGVDDREAALVVEAVAAAVRGTDGGDVAVVDLGRLLGADPIQGMWLHRCDTAVVVVGGDVDHALVARAVVSRLAGLSDASLGVVVVGSGTYDCAEVATFTGLAPFGDVPFDPAAAAVAAGASGAARRLGRSTLLAATRRLAGRLADGAGARGSVDVAAAGTPVPAPRPVVEVR